MFNFAKQPRNKNSNNLSNIISDIINNSEYKENEIIVGHYYNPFDNYCFDIDDNPLKIRDFANVETNKIYNSINDDATNLHPLINKAVNEIEKSFLRLFIETVLTTFIKEERNLNTVLYLCQLSFCKDIVLDYTNWRTDFVKNHLKIDYFYVMCKEKYNCTCCSDFDELRCFLTPFLFNFVTWNLNRKVSKILNIATTTISSNQYYNSLRYKEQHINLNSNTTSIISENITQQDITKQDISNCYTPINLWDIFYGEFRDYSEKNDSDSELELERSFFRKLNLEYPF